MDSLTLQISRPIRWQTAVDTCWRKTSTGDWEINQRSIKDQILDRSQTQIRLQNKDQILHRSKIQIIRQIRNQVLDRSRTQIRLQIRDQILDRSQSRLRLHTSAFTVDPDYHINHYSSSESFYLYLCKWEEIHIVSWELVFKQQRFIVVTIN